MGLGPKEMGEAMFRNMKDKTGKTVPEWIQILENEKIGDKKEALSFLKTKHKLGHFQAVLIFKASQKIEGYAESSNFIKILFPSDAMMGKYKEVSEYITSLGRDVRIQPCKTYIPFYKKNQFALVAPNGNYKMILGINLPNEELPPNSTCKMGSYRINCQLDLPLETAINIKIKVAIKAAYKNN